MMPIVSDVALAVGSTLTASIITKATLTMALTLVGVRLVRKSRAAVRHLLLAAGFAVLLALPVVSIAVPSVPFVEVPIVTGGIAESPVLPSLTDSTPAADSVSAVSGRRVMIPSSRVSAILAGRAASVVLLAGWATGALLFLLPVVVGLWQVRALRRLGRPWQHGQSVLRQLAADAGLHRRIDVLLYEAVLGPLSCGVVRPTIVLPIDAQTWHEDDLGRAIVHELEHVRRGDWAGQCLARAVCACYWFHPLVWIAWRQLALEAERACDDALLQRAEATAYADQLVVLAERLSAVPKRSLLAMANRTDLATRVVAVLDSRQQRGRAGTFSLALVCVASALLVATISPLRVAAAQIPTATQTFTGSLIDPLGRTLPDTKLTLWNVSTQQPVETRSDQSGRLAFRGIPTAEYRLQVQGFGSQGQITLAPGQHLNRDIALLVGGMDGLEYTVTVHRSDAPAVPPPPPSSLPPPSNTSPPYPGQADLDRCAQVSMFCRVTPPVQVARAQPVYPTKQRETGVAGTVVVDGRIGTDGLLKDLGAVAPADPDFAGATVDALRRWQFTAVRLDGAPVEMNIHVTANFVVQ
jgi:beta-lactamase regulating signal transducer with metallopeptidase domain